MVDRALENAKEYGCWDMLQAHNRQVMLNSSHTYPLRVDDYVEGITSLVNGNHAQALYAEVRPTNSCNHSCQGCFSKESRKKGSMISPARLTRLIEELDGEQVKLIRFSGGGEPLLYPGLETMIAKTYEQGMGTMLITNGSRLYQTDLELLTSSLHMIRVSINGGENSHFIIHGCDQGDFGKIIQSLEMMSNIRAKKNLGEQLHVGVTYLVSPTNMQDIASTAKLLRSVGVDGLYFRAWNNHSQLSDTQLEQLRDQQRECKDLSNNDFFVHFAERLSDASANPSINETHCYSSQLRLYIEANGQMSFCGRWSGTNQFQLGNINTQSLQDILTANPVLEKMRNTPVMKCDKCDCVYFNKAMDFIKIEHLRDPATIFERRFYR